MDGFQGGEKEAIVLSLVRSNPGQRDRACAVPGDGGRKALLRPYARAQDGVERSVYTKNQANRFIISSSGRTNGYGSPAMIRLCVLRSGSAVSCLQQLFVVLETPTHTRNDSERSP